MATTNDNVKAKKAEAPKKKEEPINPAIDPSLSAEERLAALAKQHEEMAKG